MHYLLGISHKDEQELEAVLQKIDQLGITKAGLELPEDYITRRAFGLTIFFFGSIAEHLEKKGVRICPLEYPETWDEMQAREISRAVRDGRMSEKDLWEEYEERIYFSNPFAPPEIAYCNNKLIKYYQRTLQILDETPKLEDLIALCKCWYEKRDSEMTETIKEHQPELIVIGYGHAQSIKRSLPEYNVI